MPVSSPGSPQDSLAGILSCPPFLKYLSPHLSGLGTVLSTIGESEASYPPGTDRLHFGFIYLTSDWPYATLNGKEFHRDIPTQVYNVLCHFPRVPSPTPPYSHSSASVFHLLVPFSVWFLNYALIDYSIDHIAYRSFVGWAPYLVNKYSSTPSVSTGF